MSFSMFPPTNLSVDMVGGKKKNQRHLQKAQCIPKPLFPGNCAEDWGRDEEASVKSLLVFLH